MALGPGVRPVAIPKFQVVLTQEFLVHPEGPQVPGILPPFTLCLLAYFLSPLYLSCPSLAPQASPYFSQPTLPPIRLPWLPSPMRQCPCLLGLAFRHDPRPPSQLPNLMPQQHETTRKELPTPTSSSVPLDLHIHQAQSWGTLPSSGPPGKMLTSLLTSVQDHFSALTMTF